ncbi:hypothetical protein [Nostoc sp. LPT]|uniref:hypothetical protein n=1 Tax=Nostoc sp. LPT TaxID=2815387 RepID=UPI001DD4D6F7|nr:hypothetical protein [Nostoc sp. LPT]MBN4000697.1 hypothetical protein [Nostoc sp. LPT]
MTQITLETQLGSLERQAAVNETWVYIPVVERVLDRILEEMEKAGWKSDYSLNKIDDFDREIGSDYWSKLTPRRKNAKVIYIKYFYAI